MVQNKIKIKITLYSVYFCFFTWGPRYAGVPFCALCWSHAQQHPPSLSSVNVYSVKGKSGWSWQTGTRTDLTQSTRRQQWYRVIDIGGNVDKRQKTKGNAIVCVLARYIFPPMHETCIKNTLATTYIYIYIQCSLILRHIHQTHYVFI